MQIIIKLLIIVDDDDGENMMSERFDTLGRKKNYVYTVRASYRAQPNQFINPERAEVQEPLRVYRLQTSWGGVGAGSYGFVMLGSRNNGIETNTPLPITIRNGQIRNETLKCRAHNS